MIERHHHVGLDHALQLVVGRNDHVIAGIAALELGEELVVVGEEIHLGFDAGGRCEIGQGVFRRYRCPSCRVEFLLFLGKREARQEGQAGEHGAGALQQGAAAGLKILGEKLSWSVSFLAVLGKPVVRAWPHFLR